MHNTCFTLPVLFAVRSDHYSFTRKPPAELAGADSDGGCGYGDLMPYALVGLLAIVAVIVWLRSEPPSAECHVAIK